MATNNANDKALFNAEETKKILEHIGQSATGNHGRTYTFIYTLYGSPRSAHIKGDTVTNAITNFANAVPYDAILEVTECESEPRTGYLHWLELLTEGHTTASELHYELQIGKKMLLMRYAELNRDRLRMVNVHMLIKQLEKDCTERAELIYGAESVEAAKEKARTQEKQHIELGEELRRAQTLNDIEKTVLANVQPAFEHIRQAFYRGECFPSGDIAVVGRGNITGQPERPDFILNSEDITKVIEDNATSREAEDKEESKSKDGIPDWLQEPKGGE